jgi:hypothetical protein
LTALSQDADRKPEVESLQNGGLAMTRLTISEHLEDCIQRIADEVLQEVQGLTEDEKNVHYLCRAIEHLVRLYSEDAKLPQKQLAHERLNRYLQRLNRTTAQAASFDRNDAVARSLPSSPIVLAAIGRTERKRRPMYR